MCESVVQYDVRDVEEGAGHFTAEDRRRLAHYVAACPGILVIFFPLLNSFLFQQHDHKRHCCLPPDLTSSQNSPRQTDRCKTSFTSPSNRGRPAKLGLADCRIHFNQGCDPFKLRQSYTQLRRVSASLPRLWALRSSAPKACSPTCHKLQ